MIGYKYDAVESFVYIRRVPVSNDNIVFESENARFLQRVSIALAMQSAVLAMIDSVCLTV